MAKISKVKLSNGQIYSFFDNDAIRLNEDGKLIVGNEVIDKLILDGGLTITEINDVPLEDVIDNVLTQDPLTKEIKKRSTDILLEDIGGCSYNMDNETGILSLKIGKQ